MSLKGNLDAITSHIRRSKDPVLLDQAKSLLKQIFQLIDRICELEKENEAIQDLLKKYEKKSKK
jgi:inhibitor of KinA sporulation pathway (predicted exonuclease)